MTHFFSFKANDKTYTVYFAIGFCSNYKTNRCTHLCQQGIVHGRAFQVQERVALPYLEKRECTLGGYTTTISTFHSRDGGRKFPAIDHLHSDEQERALVGRGVAS